jgi:hypothetical protein
MITDVHGSKAYSVERKSGVHGLYVVENEPLERMLFDRNVIDLPFKRNCWEASRLFIRHLADELVVDDVSELVLLSKGLVYQLGEAMAAEGLANLPVNLVATSRVAVSSADARVEILYSSFDAGGSTLIIGDTVASGATVVAALEKYTTRHYLRHVYILAYAGALVGAARIADYCAMKGVRATILFGLGAFGLGENGFDLSFLHPATVTKSHYRQRAFEQFDGKNVSSVGWDFGSQVTSPTKYRALCWIEAEVWGLHGSPALALEQRPASPELVSHEAPAYSGLESGRICEFMPHVAR